MENIDLYESFLNDFKEYSMHVISDRALPDIRDGLKPVQRRIIFEMLDNNMTSKAKMTKVARIVGQTMAKWHPHGDSAIANALAYLSQQWSYIMPVIEIKGNNGSIHGDGPAAARYIEARLTPTGDSYGKILRKGVVPYSMNYDDTESSPDILPAQLPYLLINGAEGIAVGFATNIPTHNPVEVINAFIAYIKNKKLTTADLLEILKGPDFVTAGTIINQSELVNLYEKGYGRIVIRGHMVYDEKTHMLHITEIPNNYAGSMDDLINTLTLATVESVDRQGRKKEAKLQTITEVTDYSGKDGIDIALTIKKGVDYQNAMQEIYAKTRMETTIKFDFRALNNKQSHRYSLIDYFSEYLDYQHFITKNEHQILMDASLKRLNILKGLIILQDIIDEVLASAKASKNKSELKKVLMTGLVLEGVPKKYHKLISSLRFEEEQAEHIANLPIYRISKMDYDAIVKEAKQKQDEFNKAKLIVDDKKKRENLIIKRHKSELKNLKGYDRKTRIIDDALTQVPKTQIKEVTYYVNMDHYQYVKIQDKPFENAKDIRNTDRLGFITDDGVLWNYYMSNSKPTTGRGTLSTQLIQTSSPIVGMTTYLNSQYPKYGLFVYEDGSVKRVDMTKFMTKQKTTKVKSGQIDKRCITYKDIPEGTKTITINDKVIDIHKIPIQSIKGKGKLLLTPSDHYTVVMTQVQMAPVDDNEPVIDVMDGLVEFDGSDTLTFNWGTTNVEDKKSDTLFAITYQNLLKSELLFVRADGLAKRVDGSQFAVKTKRQSIQCDKTNLSSQYINICPKTITGHYRDGYIKKINTADISKQGKLGGGVRALFTKKYELEKISDTDNPLVELSTLAMQPKKVTI